MDDSASEGWRHSTHWDNLLEATVRGYTASTSTPTGGKAVLSVSLVGEGSSHEPHSTSRNLSS